jgi:UDP-3-O-[3-hydroxymyristoyl] glucosamine N-acyltransferase
MIGGQVGIAGHLTIGNNVRIQAQSGVGRNIKDDEILQGSQHLVTMILANHMFISRICLKIVAELEKLKKQIIKPKKKGNNG